MAISNSELIQFQAVAHTQCEAESIVAVKRNRSWFSLLGIVDGDFE